MLPDTALLLHFAEGLLLTALPPVKLTSWISQKFETQTRTTVLMVEQFCFHLKVVFFYSTKFSGHSELFVLYLGLINSSYGRNAVSLVFSGFEEQSVVTVHK